jgi:hypothetical protein
MTEQDTTNAAQTKARLQIEYWPLDRLIPYARSARTHSPAQVAEIAGSIRAYGFSNPILVSEHADIIAGHGRLAAARKLGLRPRRQTSFLSLTARIEKTETGSCRQLVGELPSAIGRISSIKTDLRFQCPLPWRKRTFKSPTPSRPLTLAV